MLKLSVNDIAKNKDNCYSFVIGVAKRARQISEQADSNGVLLDRKPVTMAIEDFINDKVKIITPEPTFEKDRIRNTDKGQQL